MNCENIPLKLRENQGNVEVLFLTPPDPLHAIYLGSINHAWTCLTTLTDLRPFEIEHHMKSSGQEPGGDFNGPTIENILKDKNLTNLSNFLQLHLHPFVEYLKTIKNVHLLSTAKTLPENYKNILADFRKKFDYLYYNFNLSMTLKIHVIYHHFEDYFELSGETLQTKTTEYTESTHSKLRVHEEVHGYRVVKHLGTNHHVEKSMNSIVHWNSKNIICLN